MKAIFKRLKKLERRVEPVVDSEGWVRVGRVLERRKKRLGEDDAEVRMRLSAVHHNGRQTVSGILRRRPWA